MNKYQMAFFAWLTV